jgi:hypothetical protein
VLGYFAAVSSIAGILTITTDKSTYQQGETITFPIRNNGFTPLQFPDPGLGLRIMNLDTGKFVSTGRIAPAVINNIGPFQWETTRWAQTEPIGIEKGQIEYRVVEPGNYVATVMTAGGFEPSVKAEVTIRIS